MAYAAYIPYILAAVGTVYAGAAANANAKAQSDQMKNDALTARRVAGAREEQQRRTNRMRLAHQRASVAQTGFDPNTGSLAMLQVESAGNAELDALTTRYSGELQSLSLENGAATTRASGRNQQTSGFLNAAGVLGSGYARYGMGASLMPESAQTSFRQSELLAQKGY